MHTAFWVVVVPVKPLATAKSRLRPGTDRPTADRPGTDRPAADRPAADRQRLALSFAQDTVRATLACDRVIEVLVVTADAVVAKALGELGAYVVPDKPDAGLNAALRHAGRLAEPHPVAALTADLPALRTADLTAALTAARAAAQRSARAFVPDAPGTGTVLLTAPAGVPLDPRFGPGSAAAHAASGALRLAGRWPSLRRDVDTDADLAEAAALGLGPHTAALLG